MKYKPFVLPFALIILFMIIINNYNCDDNEHSNTRPTYILHHPPHAKTNHLRLIFDALQKMGFSNIGSNWNDIKNLSNWDLLWSHRYFSKDILSDILTLPFSTHHRINHYLGIGTLASKKELYRTFTIGQNKYGNDIYNFMPESFLYPMQKNQLKIAVENNEKKAANNSKPTDPYFNKRWLYKSYGHRGIQLVNNISFNINYLTPNKLITKYIEPLLVGSHKFDVGVHILILSLNPLKIYMHKHMWIRVCELPYSKILKANDNIRTYVIDDHFMSAWNNSYFRKYYKQIPNKLNAGTKQRDVICNYLNDNQFDCNEWLDSVKAIITKMILISIDTLYGKVPKERINNFFELVRFDFVIDYLGKPWIIEMNMSPSMNPKYFVVGTDEGLKRNIIESALKIVNIQSKYDHKNPFYFDIEKKIKNQNEILNCKQNRSIISNEALNCLLRNSMQNNYKKQSVINVCNLCLKVEELSVLLTFFYEYTQRDQFELIYPIMKDTYSNVKYRNEILKISKNENNNEINNFLNDIINNKFKKDFSKDGIYKNIKIENKCFTRGNCDLGGNCLGGVCVYNQNCIIRQISLYCLVLTCIGILVYGTFIIVVNTKSHKIRVN
eukprot:325086_1